MSEWLNWLYTFLASIVSMVFGWLGFSTPDTTSTAENHKDESDKAHIKKNVHFADTDNKID